MKRPRVPILLAACLCVTTGLLAADEALTLQANETSVQLAPREQGPQQVSLSSLEFSLHATTACPPGTDVESVTVSIADTHKRFGPDDISDNSALDVRLSVPADQVAPVTVSDFCVSGEPGDKNGLLVPGVATAQASLRCQGDNKSSLYFKSAVLPIRLHCAIDKDQEASTDR